MLKISYEFLGKSVSKIQEILPENRLCCLVKPNHKCQECHYTVCEECGKKLMDSFSFVSAGHNLLFDDHEINSNKCENESIHALGDH